jgi:hypothetical protein
LEGGCFAADDELAPAVPRGPPTRVHCPPERGSSFLPCRIRASEEELVTGLRGSVGLIGPGGVRGPLSAGAVGRPSSDVSSPSEPPPSSCLGKWTGAGSPRGICGSLWAACGHLFAVSLQRVPFAVNAPHRGGTLGSPFVVGTMAGLAAVEPGPEVLVLTPDSKPTVITGALLATAGSVTSGSVSIVVTPPAPAATSDTLHAFPSHAARTYLVTGEPGCCIGKSRGLSPFPRPVSSWRKQDWDSADSIPHPFTLSPPSSLVRTSIMA